MSLKAKILFYGAPGIGKTTIFKSGKGDKRIFPMLLLSFEGGEMAIGSVVRQLKTPGHFYNAAKAITDPKPVKGQYKIAFSEYMLNEVKPDMEHIDTLRIKGVADLDDVLNAAENGVFDAYQSLGVDSLSEICYMILKDIIEEAGIKNPGKRDGEKAELQDYMIFTSRVRTLVRRFRDLDMHVFFTAHQTDKKDEMSGISITGPNFSGKLGIEIPGIIDIMGYMTTVKGTADAREIFFQPTTTTFAKDRSEGGALGKSMLIENNKTKTLVAMFDKLGIPLIK